MGMFTACETIHFYFDKNIFKAQRNKNYFTFSGDKMLFREYAFRAKFVAVKREVPAGFGYSSKGGTGQIWLQFLFCGKKLVVRLRKASAATLARVAFTLFKSGRIKKKSTPNGVLLQQHYIYRPDLSTFLPMAKIKVRLRKASAATLIRVAFTLFKSGRIKKKKHTDGVLFFLEVPARFELADQSFADSCLTTWLRYHL